jgi:hypothetical protein
MVATHPKTRGVIIEMTSIEQYLALFEHQLIEDIKGGEMSEIACNCTVHICAKMQLHYSSQWRGRFFLVRSNTVKKPSDFQMSLQGISF